MVSGYESWNFRMFEGFTLLFSVFEIILKAVDIFNECKLNFSQFLYIYYAWLEKDVICC